MASSGLRENVILMKITLLTDRTKICAKGDMSLRAWHPQKDHTCQRCRCKLMAPYLLWPFWVGSSKVSLKIEGGVALQDLMPDVRQLELVYVPVKGWMMYMTSLMLLVILCTSLLTIKKLSTLM